ncbi:GAF domain-containing protein [Williamsia sp. D3]|uniref:GAF domain-containing sensor histidine kinase n=1 Tax=Williamsia sp. D3 TaxID=1313067 RepID=UPI0005716AC8|nr:GAF domain-containing protein [Williamsia sp. D3]
MTRTHSRLRSLIAEASEQIGRVAVAENRTDELVDALLTVAADLDLEATLRSIVASAVTLTDARYGALGVWNADRTFAAFIHQGIGEDTQARIGALPIGRGLLGLVAETPGVVRLDNLTHHNSFIGFPPHHPPMASFLGCQIRAGDEVFGSLYLAEKNGRGPFTEDDENMVRTVALSAAIAIDHARVHAEAHSQLEWTEATRDALTQLMTGVEVGQVLSTIARNLVRLTSADTVIVAQPLDTEQPCEAVSEVAIAAIAGNGGSMSNGQTFSVDLSLPGPAFAIADPMSEHSASLEGYVSVFGASGPAMVVPLNTDQSIFGVVLLSRTEGSTPFTQETLVSSAKYADQVALGLSMAAEVQRSRNLEVMADRERIARVLHDHVIQRIFAAGMSLHGTLQRAQSPTVQRRLTETVNDLQDIIQEIRTTIFDLQPDGHESTRLRQRIHEVIDQQTRDYAGRTFVRMSGPLSVVEPRLADNAVAVVREGVSNAVRYASPDTITVIVSLDDNLVIEVSDDGVGMGDDVTPGGLINLRDRARDLGGDLIFTPRTAGSGVMLKWWVPLDP